MRGLSLIFVEVFEEQMDEYLNDRFTVEIIELQKRLMEFSRTDAERLTNKQDAQRRLLINWLYIAQQGDSGESPITMYLEMVQNRLQGFISTDAGPAIGVEGGEPIEINEDAAPVEAAPAESDVDESLNEVGHPEEL